MELLTRSLNENNTAKQLSNLPSNVQVILQELSNKETNSEIEKLSFILTKWNESVSTRNIWKIAISTVVGIASVAGKITLLYIS